MNASLKYRVVFEKKEEKEAEWDASYYSVKRKGKTLFRKFYN